MPAVSSQASDIARALSRLAADSVSAVGPQATAWRATTSESGVLVIAGLYQYTRWKLACLSACRSPLSFLMTHDFGSGAGGAFRVGLSHGAYCLGCCWALMAVLFVVGLMNLAWMAGIAIVFLAEKNWRRGVGLTYIVGAAVALLGVAVIAHPALLTSISHSAASSGGGMMMGR